MKITKEQILQIPKLKKAGYSDAKIGEMWNIHPRSVGEWKKKLKKAGHKITSTVRVGRKGLIL